MNLDYPYQFGSLGRTAESADEPHIRDLIEQVPVKRMTDVLDYQSSVQDAAQTAARNGVRKLVSELREVRNSWAHQNPFSLDDTYRALDSVQRLLSAVSAAAEADEVEKQNSTIVVLKSVDLHPLEANIFTKAWLEAKSR